MPITTIRTRTARLLLGVLCAIGAPAIGKAQTGYWQYVKTDSYIDLYANQGGNPAKPYPDTYVGGEGALTVTIGTGQQTFRFSGSFAWSRPPAILIPGTALYWPASVTITQNTGNNPPYLGFFLTANLYPYQSVSNLANYTGHSSPYLIEMSPDSGLSSSNPAGSVFKYNNATQASPTKIPVGNSGSMDANGQMTILTAVQSSTYFYWSYVYQWVPGAEGSCGGTCSLASSGQSLAAAGGQGSVNLTATSTWNAIAVDNWIALTSPASGTGNSSVTFTVSPNTSGPRTGTLIVGGQQYTIYQDGTGGSVSTGDGGLGTTNIALNKPVTVSSQYPTVSGTASAITSNPFAAAWFAFQGAPSYCSIVVDLGQTYSLGAIEIDPQQTFDYQLSGSTDGTNYTPIASYTWPAYVSLPVSIAVNGASSARYIKYTGHTPWDQYVGLAGMRVYEWLSSAPAPQPASAYGTTNLALGKPVQNLSGYTSASANPPANVDDGNPSTAWYGTNDTYYKNASTYDYSFTAGGVQIDLGQQVNLGKIVLTPAKAQVIGMFLTPDTTTPVNFLFSSDQTMFTTATTGSTPQTFYIDGRVTARYVWLYAWNLTPGGTAVDPGIDEIAVYAFNPASTCSYTLGATSASPAASGGAATVTVTAGTGCTWTAASNATWITISSGASGTGNGTVSYTVTANTGAARSGTLTIAGATFTVSQAAAGTAGCSYNVSPTDIQAPAGGVSNTVLIFTNSGCTWTASVPSTVSWITLSPTSGSGGGAVGYAISANTGAARNTTITVAGTAVTVEQAAGSNCTYILSATSSPQISGVGGVGSVAVTVAGTACAAWSVATPSVNWVHVAGGGGSTSSGTVSYSVDSNSAPSARSTTLTIANQSYTVSQAAAPCTYALSAASSGALAAGGASGSFQVTAAGPACTWSITLPTDANSQWIHVISSLNAMSSGAVSYTVDPNNTTSARTLALTLNGKNPATTLTYTVNQAAGTANTAPPPVVDPNGIVNAASFISAYLPAGSIAQGSFFSIFGNNLGPPNPGQKAQSYPLGTNLAGVTVTVTQGSATVAAIPVFVAQYQINAVMPSNAPTGTVQVTVSYNGLTSAPAPVQVVVANFGAFTVSGGRGPGIVQNFVSATQLPLNMTTLTAAPGDYAVLWGTGLGPLPGGASDTQPPAAGSLPATVQVLLGNQTIAPAYAGRAPGLAGVDQIDFQLPSNATLGCYVPLQVVVNGNASNTVTMAIANSRQPCSDTNPFSATSRNGGANGSIALARLNYTDPTNALKIGSGTVDVAMATFSQSTGTGTLGFSLFASLPPMNTCTYYNNVGTLNGLLGGQMPSSTNSAAPTPLDAGPTITVKGPNGTQGVSYSNSSAQVSPYLGVLGTSGGWSALGLGPGMPFLDPGTYTVSGAGGKDVGPFQYTIQIPSGATWTNRDSTTTVNRSQGLTVEWSGGASTQAVAIVGYSSNPALNVSGGFACLSDMAPQSFTVPSSYLVNLPATPTSNPGNAISALLFATVPTASQFVTFGTSAAPSLDSGLGYYAVGELRNNVVFQ